MASQAAAALTAGVAEVIELLRADPAPQGGISPRPALSKAIARASVVLIVSHLERFIYASNEAATLRISSTATAGDRLPNLLRLRHSRLTVDDVFHTQWLRRGPGLEQLVAGNSWLWTNGAAGTLNHERLLDWMTTPNPKSLVKYYRIWGVDNVFNSITRGSQVRADLLLRITEVVDKRNAIAHGDASVDPTRADVRAYLRAVATFAYRTDRLLARRLATITGNARPW